MSGNLCPHLVLKFQSAWRLICEYFASFHINANETHYVIFDNNMVIIVKEGLLKIAAHDS